MELVSFWWSPEFGYGAFVGAVDTGIVLCVAVVLAVMLCKWF